MASSAEFLIILPSCASCTAQSMEAAVAAASTAAGSDAWSMGWLSAGPVDGLMSPSKGSDLVTGC